MKRIRRFIVEEPDLAFMILAGIGIVAILFGLPYLMSEE